MECPLEQRVIEKGFETTERALHLEERIPLHYVGLPGLHGARLPPATHVGPVHSRREVRPDGQQLSAIHPKGCNLHSHTRLSHLSEGTGKKT